MRRILALAPLATLLSAVLALPAASAVPQGSWSIDARVAVQIYECEGNLCGRIIWLEESRDLDGLLKDDKSNPDPKLRKRPLCGLTILGGLHRDGPSRWASGWFYNPDDGKTYSVSADLDSADVITARIYAGTPIFGRTKTLLRVPRLSTEGWC